MVATTRPQIDMTDMIVCNEEISLYVSKPQKKNSDYTPEFGQEVILTSAVTAGDTEISVEPLNENIKAGSVLDFKDAAGVSLGIVTVAVPPDRGATTVVIDPAVAGIANYSAALTDGVEQTLVLANAVVAGDRLITLASALTDWVEKGRLIRFENGVEVIAKVKTEVGATEIIIDPAPFAIPAGESAILKNYLEICSINQLDDSSSANTLNERNFKSGSGTGKAVTSYNDTVTIGGNYVIGDFALFRLYNSKQDPTLRGYILHAVIVEPEGGQDLMAKIWLGQHGNQRPNDQTKKISATLEVDGILGNTLVPRALLN